MGFDNECIVNIQSLPGEYFCPVCRLLVYPNEALQSQCTHLYCKPCLTYIVGTTRACPYDGYLVTEADSKPLLESNKTLAETIGKVLVHCLYQKSGCTWQGSLSDCTPHCTGCAFGNSSVLCNRCGIQILHRQVHEHAHSCPGVQQHQAGQSESSQAVAATSSTAFKTDTSQATAALAPHNNPQAVANLQTPAVSAGPSMAEQWYQQQFYQQYSGHVPNQQHQYVQQDYIHNPQQHIHSRPPQQTPGSLQQQIQVQPQDQTRQQFQAQPYLQGQVRPQLHPVIQTPPGSQSLNQAMVSTHSQAQPAMLPYSLVPSQTHPSSQGHTNREAQPNSYPQGYQQAQVQHTQIPQFQQMPEKLNRPSQHPQTNQPLRPPAQVVAGQQTYPQQQPNQQTQFGGLPSNTHAPHHGGVQQAVPPVQVQNQYRQKLPNLRPPQSHFPTQNQQPPAQGQFPSFPPTQQQPLHHPNSHQAVVSVKNPVVRPVQQSPLQQHLGRPSGGIHHLMHQQSAGMLQQVPMQSQLLTQSQPQSAQQQYPPSVQAQQSMANHELQQQPHQPSAGAFQGRREHLGPNYPAAGQVDIQRTENKLPLMSEGKSNEHGGNTAESADERETKSISGATETKSLNAENGLNSSDGTKVKEMLKSEFNTNTDLDHYLAKSEEPVTKQMVEEMSPGIPTNSENPVLGGKESKDSLTVTPPSARLTDQSEEKMRMTNSDRMATEMQPTLTINQSSNQPPVDQASSSFLKRDAQHGAPHNFHTLRQPPSVFRPHSPEVIPGSTPHLPSASSSDREPSQFGLAHPTSVGPYDQGLPLPSHNSRISSNLTNPQLRDERFNPFPDDRLNIISVDSSRHHQLDQNFLRPPQVGRFPGPESGVHIPSSSPFDGGFGLNAPPRSHGKHNVDFGTGAAPRFLHERPVLHDNGKGIHTNFPGPVMGSDRLIEQSRSSMSEYPVMSSRGKGFSQGGPGERFLGMDATDSKDPHRFGFPSHLHRREFVGPADIRIGEHIRRGDLIGPDVEPSHIWRGDHLGPRGLPGHLSVEERAAFAGFPPSRPGEPGFRSKFSLQRFPDGGPFAGDMEPLGSLKKRKPISIWWCRLCKVDCETTEGLDLHSQSKEHQKRSMDIVSYIKQNAKKHKPLPGFR